MPRQAKINEAADNTARLGATTERSDSHESSLAGVLHDITELADLQAKLFVVDAKDAVQRSILSIALVVTAVCLLLGAIPIVLMALAAVLADQFELTRTQSLFAAAGSSVAVAALFLGLAWWRLRQGMQRFEGSIDELGRNVAWVKHVLQSVRVRRRTEA